MLLGVTVVAVNGLGADVLPGAFVEGPVDVVAVDPRDLGEFAVGEADPDLAHVVGVVVDLPFPAASGDGGGLAAVRGEEVGVVGAVVDGDAAGGDGLPAHGEQFEVVAPGQRDGGVSGDGDECGPHLVRGECLPGHHRVAQPFVGPVVVVHQPLIEEVLELGDAVAGVFLGVGAAAGDVGSGVAGQVLAEQGVDGAEGALDDALRGGGAGRGGPDADAEALAGGGERGGDEDFAAVDDDRLGQDDRPGRRTGQTLIQRGQPLVGECAGVVHAQDVRPGRPGRVRDRHLREQQSRVDGFGRAGAQHGGEDGAGGDVDGDSQLGPGQAPVVEEGEDIQAGGVDLDLLTRPQRHGGGEGPPLDTRGHLPHRTAGQFAGAGEGGDEPVERGLGRHGYRTGAVLIFEDLVDEREQAVDGAFGAPAPAAQRFTDGGDDAFVGPPGRAGGTGGAVVQESPQALFAISEPHALHRGARDTPEAERGQLFGLGLLPLGQRVPLWVVLLPHRSSTAGPVGKAAVDFPHVPLPGQGLLTCRGGGGLEQPPLRGRLRYIGSDDAEAGVCEQVPGEPASPPPSGPTR